MHGKKFSSQRGSTCEGKFFLSSLFDIQSIFFQPAVSMEIALGFGSEIRTPNLVVPLRLIWYRRSSSLSRIVVVNDTASGWAVHHSAIGAVSNRFADVTGFMKANNSGYTILKWQMASKREAEKSDWNVAMLVADYTTG